MQTFFGASGSLAAVLPGFEPRPQQGELAAAVADALECGEHLLAEAGTGTGKSLAYIIPALLSGQRVVVATATKALQNQLLTKDVPSAARALGRDVRCVVLKGRQNYLCRKSLHGLELLGGSGPALFRTEGDAGEYERLREWVESTETGDRAELGFEPSASLWADLAVGADRCQGKRCPLVSSCYSEAARERAGAAELVIVNHALYFADLALRARSDGTGVLPDHDAVVFDEAHRLEEAASAWFGGRVSVARLRQLVRDVERSCREEGRVPPVRALAAVDRMGSSLVASLEPVGGRTRLTAPVLDPFLDQAFALGEALGELAQALAGGGEEAEGLRRRALDAADDLDACLVVDHPERVSWAEAGALAWAPVEVSELLRDELWDRPVTSVLVSATLDERFAQARLGLQSPRTLVAASPFEFRDQALVYVPARLPEPRAPGYAERLADEVTALCRVSRGRALVLTSSYRALDSLVELVAPRLRYTVLCQGDAPRERLLERFRDEVDSVLFATSTFWQGIDVQGESLSLLVIDKLPFSAPGDPLVEARCEGIARRGGDWFGEYALPSAILQLRQGFGRLIRSHSDEGVVAILDSRLRTKGYGRRFLEALPPCPVVSELDEVAAFYGSDVRASA
ncbi:MAG TPA: ATP-dependent DNA helicase [Gaiellaceae bacterium]|nr:ATP-dependent DNA helicase [Gaiellaceae bacterium]